MHPNEYQIIKYMSVRDLSARFGVSIPTIWNWVKKGNLPRPTKLSPQSVRWEIGLIESWEAMKREAV